MKIFATIMKIVAALAAIAGIVYVVATYGDKIVAWAKGLLGKCSCCCGEECCCCEEDCCCEETCCCEEAAEEVAEEAAAETVEAEEKDFEA
jgi:hypothetical protein